MPKPLFKALACALGIAVLACAHARQPAVDSSSDRQAIEAASRAFSDAFVRNDSQALGEIYTEDAVLLPHGREVRGREEIRKFFTWRPQQRQIAHSMQSSHLDLRGDTAIDTGTWHSTIQRGDDPETTSSGAYLVVWVR